LSKISPYQPNSTAAGTNTPTRADIKTCQSTYGKTILLSIGGATYTEGGFSSPSVAQTWGDNIWAMFGPVQSGSSAKRPFGTAVVDGFDFDFESATQNMAPFASRLRSNMDAATAATGRKFYLSAAPQCVYPDAADHEMLDGAVSFDFIMIQFYNNWCGVSNFQPGAATQNAFNFDVWDNWAKTVSKNKAVKLLLGIPASTGAGGGYVSGSQLSSVVAYSKQFSTFGGVMMWDMSQLYRNTGYLASVVAALGGSSPPPTSTTTGTRPTSTMITTTRPTNTAVPTGTLVPQWGQCGGQGWTGSTQCQPPYTCTYGSVWYSDCR
jgi:chitinase